MRGLLMDLCAVAIVSLGFSAPAEAALFGRRAPMMNCNVNQAAPVQATAQNLTPTLAARTYSPLPATADVPQMQIAKRTKTGVSLKALLAIQANTPALSNVAAK